MAHGAPEKTAAVGYTSTCELGTEQTILANAQICARRMYSSVEFNVPPNTLQVISETIFTGQMTQPTVSSTEGQQLRSVHQVK